MRLCAVWGAARRSIALRGFTGAPVFHKHQVASMTAGMPSKGPISPSRCFGERSSLVVLFDGSFGVGFRVMSLQHFFQLFPRSQQCSGAVPVFNARCFKYSIACTNNCQVICSSVEFDLPDSRRLPIGRRSKCVLLARCDGLRYSSQLRSRDAAPKSIPVIRHFNPVSRGKEARKRSRW